MSHQNVVSPKPALTSIILFLFKQSYSVRIRHLSCLRPPHVRAGCRGLLSM